MSPINVTRLTIEPFEENGEPGVYVAVSVCPICKRPNTIKHNPQSKDTEIEDSCEHLDAHISTTGFNCVFAFTNSNELEPALPEQVTEKEKDSMSFAIITKAFTEHGVDDLSGKRIDLCGHIPGTPLLRKRFRLYDDDDYLYYQGYFYDDEFCDNQQSLLDWAMRDSGCTKIMVSVAKGKFKQEIS